MNKLESNRVSLYDRSRLLEPTENEHFSHFSLPFIGIHSISLPMEPLDSVKHFTEKQGQTDY